MAYVYLDRDGDQFLVRVLTGFAGDKKTHFANRDDAVAFAERKMGRRGMIVDTTLMSPDQLAAHLAREESARARLAAAPP